MIKDDLPGAARHNKTNNGLVWVLVAVSTRDIVLCGSADNNDSPALSLSFTICAEKIEWGVWSGLQGREEEGVLR